MGVKKLPELLSKKVTRDVIEKFVKLARSLDIELDFSYQGKKMLIDLGEPTPKKIKKTAEIIEELNESAQYGQGQIKINYEGTFPAIKLKNFDPDYSRKIKSILIEFEGKERREEHL